MIGVTAPTPLLQCAATEPVKLQRARQAVLLTALLKTNAARIQTAAISKFANLENVFLSNALIAHSAEHAKDVRITCAVHAVMGHMAATAEEIISPSAPFSLIDKGLFSGAVFCIIRQVRHSYALSLPGPTHFSRCLDGKVIVEWPLVAIYWQYFAPRPKNGLSAEGWI